MRTLPIRVSLTTSLVAVVVGLSAAILFVTVRAGDAIVQDLSQRYLDETEEVVVARLDELFHPVVTSIEHGRSWARAGVLDPADVQRTNALFAPILAAYPQITSLATGDAAGYSYRIGAEGEGYLVRVTRAGEPDRPAEFQALDAGGALVRAWTERSDYDARSRPWYGAAGEALASAGSAAAASVVWTAPFILRTSQNPGIAACLPYEGRDGAVYMTTFNVMLTKLSEYTSSLRPTAHGLAFVLTGTGDVLGFPALDRFPTSQSREAYVQELGNRMPRLGELGVPVLDRAQRALDGPCEARSCFAPELGDGTWRLTLAPYALGGGEQLWIGVAIPDDDFLEHVHAQKRRILLVTLGALGLGVLLALFLARLYGRPLLSLVRDSARLTVLDLEGGETIRSHVTEVHRLVEAQARMRGALDSFARYVPTPVVRELLRRGEAARLGGAVRDLTIMFSDVRGFTTVSEAMSPGELTAHSRTTSSG